LVLPGIADCCWTATASQTSYPSLKKSARTDVAVVGAGIVGLTVAYALVRAGLKVTVLEARQVGRQVTGRSTAKVTSQHALIYRHLRSTFDLETARLYAEANRAGVRQIRTWVHELAIACDLEQKDAYTYTCDKSLVADIENEAEVAANWVSKPRLSLRHRCHSRPPALCVLQTRDSSTQRDIS
jgi:glycine/D-amino acid oxidase-like deaminating enzyme